MIIHTNRIKQFIYGGFIVLLIAGSIIAFSNIVTKPLMLDEVEEASIGYYLIKVGGEIFSKPLHDVTHALGYSLSHGLVQNVINNDAITLRLYGVFHFLLSLILTLLILKLLLRNSSQRIKTYSLWTCFLLFMINPLLLQHSVVVNADNNLLTTAMLATMYLFVLFENRVQSVRGYILTRLVIAFFLALSLWAKELTPLLMLGGILFYRLFSREYKKFLLDFFLIGFVGVLIFWVSWCLFCFAIQIDVLSFINYTIVGKGGKAFTSRFLIGMFSRILALLRWPIYWVSAPFWVGILLFLVSRIKHYVKRQGLNTFDLIFFVGLCIWLPYLIFKPNPDMMKYQYPAYPFFIIVLACFFGQSVVSVDLRKIGIWRHIVAFAIFLVLSCLYYNLGDYIFVLWEPVCGHLNGLFIWLYYLPLMILYLTVFILSKEMKSKFLIITIILSIFPVSLGLLISQSKANYAPVEIFRNYGEAGHEEVINYLKNNRTIGEAYFARRDIVYALEHKRGLEFRDGIYVGKVLRVSELKKAILMLSKINPDYIVLDSFSFKLGYNPDVLNFLLLRYARDKVFGDFCVLKKKNK